PGTTGELTAGNAGTGSVPSTPVRKPEAPRLAAPAPGLQFAPPVPVALQRGDFSTRVCAKPTPSCGISTLCTLLMCAQYTPKPTRTTVFPLPNRCPRIPSEYDGLQASEARGPTFP